MISRLMNCLNPRYVRNKYTGQMIAVRCGKCAVCRNTNAALWVQRLEQEALGHRYTWFVTLQYDEQHVPQMVLLDRKDSLSYPSYYDSVTNEVISLDDCPSDSKSRIWKQEVEYCENTKVLNVLSKRDIQLFVKRLRKEISKIDPDERLRFFICGEYGPQTFRSHYHCLFFGDSERVEKDFAKLLSRSWPHGNIYDPHLISGDASEYVASYLNCTTHLPEIYLHKSIRPFALYSKRPIIGTYKNRLLDLREIFFTASPTMRIWKSNTKKFDDVPLWRTLQNRLFPRLGRYDSLSDEIRELLYCEFFDYYCSGTPEQECFERTSYAYQSGFMLDGIFRRYIKTILTVDNPKTGLKKFSISSLRNYVRVCYRVYRLADEFGCDVHTVVKQIFKYYENLEKSRFYDYLKFQDEYFKEHPVSDYVLFDASFVEKVDGKFMCDLSESQRIVLQTHQISCDPVSLDYCSSFDFVNMQTLHNKIAFDTSKSKKSNDYLLAHKDKFGNIVKYKNL